MSFGPEFDAGFRARLHELLRWRRDVRRFRPDPLPSLTIERLLKIACLAPSVGLSQPWRFVLVETAGPRAAIRANFAACNRAALANCSRDRADRYARLKLAGLAEAPCHLAVFADPETERGGGLGRLTMPETIPYSAVAAVHTLWLAARAEGIGMGWVSILDPAAVRDILHVPPHWLLIGYFCLGYPASTEELPELEREGWEMRRSVDEFLVRR